MVTKLSGSVPQTPKMDWSRMVYAALALVILCVSEIALSATNADNQEFLLAEELAATDGISITLLGDGLGNVGGSQGIDCSTGTCDYSIAPGESVELTAVADISDPAYLSEFAGWGKDCSGSGLGDCTVTAPANVSAYFACSYVNLPAGLRSVNEDVTCGQLTAPSNYEIDSQVSINFFATDSVSLGAGFRVRDNGMLSVQVSPVSSAAELDPPEVTVDLSLLPNPIQIAGIDGGAPRNLVRMNSDIGDGYQFDFVENEIFLISDNPGDLSGFLSRWSASVLFQVSEIDGPGPNPKIIYLLNVDASAVDTSTLNEDLAFIESKMHGQHQVSSDTGLNMLALVASEIKNYGLNVGINVLIKSQTLAERRTQEAGVGVDIIEGATSFVYTPDGFEWPYMNHIQDLPGDRLWPLDTGVAEALRVVEAGGGFANRIRALIADGGFYPNTDFPPYTAIGALRTPNPDPSACGSGGTPSATCSAHGTHVAMAGFALPDNSFGTFGPGGPVTDLTLLQSPSVDFASVVRYITENIPAAFELRPRIINVSAGVSIPGGWCFAVCEPLDFLAGMLNRMGIVFVAAAGNQGINVDATDEVCFFGCIRFEEAAVIPCETDHVLCVGAHISTRSIRAGYSNYGSASDANSVDIFAPGNVYSVTALSADENAPSPVDDLQIINGTSFATPFTAGVVSLTWASNPSLSTNQVRNCILTSAHTSSFTGERRRINALGAVQCAMGGTHPFVEVISPLAGATFTRGTTSIVLLANADDLEDGLALNINWSSSLDGFLGSSSPGTGLNLGPLGLNLGVHEICATTTDSSARTSTDCVGGINVVTSPPIVDIIQPSIGASFIQAASINLNGTATDLDGPAPTNINWYINQDIPGTPLGSPVASTLIDSVPASTYAPGNYRVWLVVIDDDGGNGNTSVPITITANPVNIPPVITITQPIPAKSIGQVMEVRLPSLLQLQ